MRLATLCFCALIVLALAPGAAHATATSSVEWPPAPFAEASAAFEFTKWFAGTVGAEVNANASGQWEDINESQWGGLTFARMRFTLPVTGGEAKATYTGEGRFLVIRVDAPLPQRAASPEADDLHAVVLQTASALGVHAADPAWDGGYAITYPFTPQEVREWGAEIIGNTSLGRIVLFNRLGVTFREPALNVSAVQASAWLTIDGKPALTPDEAAAIAVASAQREHNATGGGTFSETLLLEMRNGTDLTYRVDLWWPSPDPFCVWSMLAFLDAETGKILQKSEPGLLCESAGPPDVAPRLPLSPALAAGAILASAGGLLVFLFFRLPAERALDHFTRGQIYGFVTANPGAIYTEVRKALRLTNGSATYHLSVLERAGFVRSVRQGRIRRIYSAGPSARLGSNVVSHLQVTILDLFHAKGPMTQAEAARALGMTRQRVHYNVKGLSSLGLLGPVGAGRLAIAPGGIEILADARRQPSPLPAPS